MLSGVGGVGDGVDGGDVGLGDNMKSVKVLTVKWEVISFTQNIVTFA